MQLRSAVLLPSVPTRSPGTQSVHATHVVAGSASSSQAPSAQSTGAAVPPAQYVPGEQASHGAGAALVPGAVRLVPGAQGVCILQLGAFIVSLKVSSGHAVHRRSAAGEPSALTKVPAVQPVHATQLVALSPS
ncbi:hypothetical protein [Sorangium sp. So ce176]|uniref:hypothetical protein n=1 Tax=Sorangium sp. So ce176 TaxID=3133286 RepID=UPI003F620C50